ncbi:hypothetical protein LWC34_45525 [Kibdelosporangium philippinense]|uniref:Rad50/SbcC-type AAA domain-containing protein n=1 Tax=Kibdelosporangium philippinense TaxID=211113 RepID=A0ABS8ZQK0_9PSEU|nr:hypothetical protein [Kibdelosporangium philippinense]MCE7010021.1 hypothetical protein [Kibdelosporangium philippinense]
MAKRLRLRALTITTETTEKTYRFAKDLTVITGSVSTGKSSLLMLIKYAFGGSAVLTPAVREHVQHVTLEVQLNQNLLRLRRNVTGDRSKVQILELGSDVPERELPVKPSPGEESASRFLLKELDIPVHRVPKSRSRRSTDFVPIGFSDVFGYCYLQAKTIDSSATGHHDPGRDSKRQTMFEILLNIIDPEIFQLKIERNAVAEEIRTQERSIDAIRNFLHVNGYADVDQLRAERWDTQEALRGSERRLDEMRTGVEALIRRDREHRNELSRVLSEAARAREVLAVARDTVRAREATLAQRRLDLAHSDKAALAAGLLSPFEFVTCPRCLQSLAGRETDNGQCLLCQQPEPQLLHESDDEQRSLLRAQITETETLLVEEQKALREAEGMASITELNAAEAQRRYDELTREAVSPRVQAIAEASTAVESLRQHLRAIDQRMATWHKLGESETTVVDLIRRRRRLDNDIKQLERDSPARQERLDEISQVFAAEVRRIGVNVNGRPTISPDKYLPKIGDSDLDTLQASGGGSTTAINVAFSLALFNYSIAHADVLLPSLLVIDSPRKGIGRTEQADQELATSVYGRLKTVAQALGGIGQLIIADNDAELGDEEDVTLIRLTEDDSAVPGVPNTGVGTRVKVEDLAEPEDE